MDKQALKSKKRGLGRGLSALFEDDEDVQDEAAGGTAGDTSVVSGARRTAGIDQLEPGPFQPRGIMDADALSELSQSIAVHGVLQPILVREKPGSEGRYEIIAGERRWRAAQKAQLHEVPILIKNFDNETALEVALIENLQREDLNAIEEAAGYRRLMNEFGHTQEKLAAALGKSRSHVANMVRLLNLPDSVLDHIRAGKLSAGHARALVTSSDPERLAQQIMAHGLNVRDAERLAADSAGKPRQPRAKAEKDIDTLALEAEVSATLGMKVAIDMRSGGAGALKIDFRSLDQLDDVLHRLSRHK